jgi:hypothetical protein
MGRNESRKKSRKKWERKKLKEEEIRKHKK